MKKLLSLLGVITLVSSATTPLVGCGTNENATNPVQEKLEINKENLTKYFAENNTWNYEGEFFFKDLKDQNEESQNEIVTAIRIATIYLFDNLIRPKFIETFNYIPENYFISVVPSLDGMKGFEYDTDYKINFSITFQEKNEFGAIIFNYTNLMLNFKTTGIYNRTDWIKEFSKYFFSAETSLVGIKKQGLSYFSLGSVGDALTEQNISNYSESNNENAKINISNELTLLLSDKNNNSESFWFYDDYKLSLDVKKYEFIGKLKDENKFVERIDGTFSYINEPTIKSDATGNILVELY
ncbi:hypothetical protein SSYRP_v1c08330 [Spiroplasma syrphidicola EA-1]|uniref:Lipoprotein n=1 Tax=Spiroplasma syrphidicola EA-1 TaxID=1276229 RepID=R4U4L2_9MOLU|nr:lipoprotein [Spiroplasma syrphidicola]AGM26422.1 hypothetical protein SSYRP_v1c08330 [Spiroplasma syrphidicola EA-1]